MGEQVVLEADFTMFFCRKSLVASTPHPGCLRRGWGEGSQAATGISASQTGSTSRNYQ